uniref:Uncharacterized protein n=1 Tax=Meloidogyne hapla TaxID=6305 RepID=A0A1I8BXZ1_MELHA
MKLNKLIFLLLIILLNFYYCFGYVLIKEKQKYSLNLPKSSFVNVDILSHKNKNNFIKSKNLLKNEEKLSENFKNNLKNKINKNHVITKRREGWAHVEENAAKIAPNNSPLKPQVFQRLQSAPSLVLKDVDNNSTLKKEEEEQEIEEENTRSSPSILAGRQYWVNALKTLLLEFRRIHPELVNGNKFKRRAAATKTLNSKNQLLFNFK